MTDTVIQHIKFTKLETYGNDCNTRWRTLPLLSCFKHKYIAVKLPPFTDRHTKCLSVLFGTSVKVNWDLTHSTEVISPDGWWPLQNFILTHFLPLSTHSHTNISKSIVQAIVYPEKYCLFKQSRYHMSGTRHIFLDV